MFERRLKVFLFFLVVATATLMVRAVFVQVINHDDWKLKEVLLQKKVQLTETIRGRILDVTGKNELAVDVPSTDACVDYRAVTEPPDPKWVAKIAADRVRSRFGKEYLVGADNHKASSAELKALRLAEAAQVRADIDSMWAALGELYPVTDDGDGSPPAISDPAGKIEEVRQGIIQDVEMRKRWAWYRNFQESQTKAGDAPKWQRWLLGASSDGPDIGTSVTVSEETEPHVILRAIDPQTVNFLGKHLEGAGGKAVFPGLALLPSTHRSYPMKEVACHVIGQLQRASVTDNELARSLNWGETRIYNANDVSGRTGIEGLCEPLLRGSRGRIERRVGDDTEVGRTEFVPGQDVYVTIDANLQAEVQEMLKHVRIKKQLNDGNYEFVTPEPGLSMHAAAVVIDVKTAEVRVLASNPGFDVNDLDRRYAALVKDRLEDPLRDRATMDAFEPGSTVKPMIGLGAITQGILGPEEGIECTGYLELPVIGPDGRPTGRKMRQPTGRCWVASEWAKTLAEMIPPRLPIHHIIPFDAPHKGHDDNADGFLTYSDALERSCNVFFETVADRLGQPGVTYWYDQFGFGRPTGIGIAESRGMIPRPTHSPEARMLNCFSGIGQAHVHATPLQIANEAATIARGGIWMRPRLLREDTQAQLDSARPRPTSMPLDQVDLHLDPVALAQAKIGMREVVNTRSAGTGYVVHLADIEIAGKTGSAQGARMWVKVVEPDGPSTGSGQGKEARQPLTPVSPANPTTPTPWYRSSDSGDMTHAWFMGYAPVDNPQVAFCVLIEYAGAGGGPAAGPVADNILEACVQHGYLHPHSLITAAR